MENEYLHPAPSYKFYIFPKVDFWYLSHSALKSVLCTHLELFSNGHLGIIVLSMSGLILFGLNPDFPDMLFFRWQRWRYRGDCSKPFWSGSDGCGCRRCLRGRHDCAACRKQLMPISRERWLRCASESRSGTHEAGKALDLQQKRLKVMPTTVAQPSPME